MLPRGRPPIESYREIMDSKILDRISPQGRDRTGLYADGAKSWKKAADSVGLSCVQVSHTDREFCKVLSEATVPKNCSTLAGTQCLDSDWGVLKRFIGSKANRSYRAEHGCKGGSPFLRNRIHQWVFRKSWDGDTPGLLLEAVLKALKQ